LADALTNRALLLAYSGRGPEARGSFDRARELCERDPAATASLANRETLAVSSFGLGMLAAEAGDLPQAEQWLKSCREARQELVKRQPERPDYYPQLAMTYDYAAELARRRQDARAALTNEEDAVRTQRRAVELAPQMARYHAPLLLYVKTLVADRLQQGEISQAAQEAERLAETLPKQGDACRTAAELLAQCLTAAKASPPDGFDAEQVALRAVALLRQAAKSGGLSAAALKETEAFAPLAPRDDFQELVRGVKDEGR
jgi:tetratricopeptide (TPR) repeat protein